MSWLCLSYITFSNGHTSRLLDYANPYAIVFGAFIKNKTSSKAHLTSASELLQRNIILVVEIHLQFR